MTQCVKRELAHLLDHLSLICCLLRNVAIRRQGGDDGGNKVSCRTKIGLERSSGVQLELAMAHKKAKLNLY